MEAVSEEKKNMNFLVRIVQVAPRAMFLDRSNFPKHFLRSLKFSFFVPLFKLVTPGRDQFWSPGHPMKKLGRRPLGYKVSMLYARLPVLEKRNFEVCLLSSYVQICDPRDRASFNPRGII